MHDLENLLNLHGETFPMDNGYWVKFEAIKVEVSTKIPQGVKYSLTLHDKHNHRVIGMTMHTALNLKRSTELKKKPMTTYTNTWR